jgi:hypothetical protein
MSQCKPIVQYLAATPKRHCQRQQNPRKCFLNFSRTHSPNSQIPASCRAVICEKIMNKSHTPTPPPLATPSRSKSHPGLTKTPKHDIYNRFKSALLVSNNHLNHLSLQIEDQSPSSPSL